jgi:hypothetical protein
LESPDRGGRPAPDLLACAMRLRAALRAMDLEAAALASAECDGHVWTLRSRGTVGPRERRRARVAARMLALCHRRVVSQQESVARELEVLGLSADRAARYSGSETRIRSHA